MRAVTKKEACELYDKLTDLAEAIAAAHGTTPEHCNDPICLRWDRFSGFEEMTDDMLLLLTEDDSPLFIVLEEELVDDELICGIITLDVVGFKDAYRDDKMLTIEYKDGCIERYIAQKGFRDAYKVHSSNRVTMPYENSVN